MKVSRIDFGRIDAAERTSQGFLKAPAYLTRAGVFTYYNADGSPRREYRSTAEVFRADSLATLISAPVTDKHPSEMVTADNRSKYDMGNIGDQIVRDGGKVAATMYVKDARLISAVERGDMRETSCGYVCDTDETPGIVPDGEPDSGQRYDAAQLNIVYNHVAVVPMGRAGSEIRMRLDAAGNAVIPTTSTEKPMHKERIDGVDYEVGTDAHKAACARRDEGEKKAKAERDALQARADAAEGEVKKLKADALEMPKKIAEQAAARATLETGARKVLGSEAKLDGKSDAEIRRMVAEKSAPSVKLDGKSDDYIAALFDRAVEHSDEEQFQLGALRVDAEMAAREPSKSERIDADAAWESMVERNRNAWKTPVADKAKA